MSANEQEFMTKLLFEKFSKVALTDKETAQVLGVSVKTLEKDRAEAIGVPYTRRNNTARGQVLYSITSIAKTLIENERRTI